MALNRLVFRPSSAQDRTLYFSGGYVRGVLNFILQLRSQLRQNRCSIVTRYKLCFSRLSVWTHACTVLRYSNRGFKCVHMILCNPFRPLHTWLWLRSPPLPLVRLSSLPMLSPLRARTYSNNGDLAYLAINSSIRFSFWMDGGWVTYRHTHVRERERERETRMI